MTIKGKTYAPSSSDAAGTVMQHKSEKEQDKRQKMEV
jgi:hypothetical protein